MHKQVLYRKYKFYEYNMDHPLSTNNHPAEKSIFTLQSPVLSFLHSQHMKVFLKPGSALTALQQGDTSGLCSGNSMVLLTFRTTINNTHQAICM